MVASRGAQEAHLLNLRLNSAAAKPGTVPGVPGGKAPQAQDEEGAPVSLDFVGFVAPELNARYAARPEVVMHGRRTYWAAQALAASASSAARLFLAWQPSLGRWAICEWLSVGSEQSALETDFLEGCSWRAFQLDSQSTADSWTVARVLEVGSWMERVAGGWTRTDAVRAMAAPPQPMVALRPDPCEQQPAAADFAGFRRLDLNSRYTQRSDLVLQGKPSFWDARRRFFLYWQSGLKRWAICGKQELDAVKKGQCPGCACQLDPVHFAAPSRWVEYTEGMWMSVPVEVTAHMPPENGTSLDNSVAPAGGAHA